MDRKRKHNDDTLPPSSPPLLSSRPDEHSSDDEGSSLFGENMYDDYQAIDELDKYEEVNLDHQDYDELDPGIKRLVDQRLEDRDIAEGKISGFIPEPLPRKKNKQRYRRNKGAEEEEEDVVLNDIADIKGMSLFEFAQVSSSRLAVKRLFTEFLTQFTVGSGSNASAYYGNVIRTMCEMNSSSLKVDFQHLISYKPVLSFLILNDPVDYLDIFNESANEVVSLTFENYIPNIASEITVRIVNISDYTSLRDLREHHLNTMISVTGTITRKSVMYPHQKVLKFNCSKCSAVLGPFIQDSVLANPITVRGCGECGARSGFVLNTEETVFSNFQKWNLQESHNDLPPGRLPRSRQLIVTGDLIDSCRPGDEVVVIGIYRNNFSSSLNTKNGFPVFSTLIEVNSVSNKQHERTRALTDADIRQIKNLSKHPQLSQAMLDSVAPSIYGHEDIKLAILLSMFGGVMKIRDGKHRLRGDVNILMMGDPGTCKSQFLKYVCKTAPRAVYTTGQGASAVGLTASVLKDPMTGQWGIESGALVLADQGICLIDEFDKMNDVDRTSIHEAMEQQSISISKAGIVATLSAQCAIIAAANPIKGKYNPNLSFLNNVELSEPIISRFDVLCVVVDNTDPDVDEQLAKHVCLNHIKGIMNSSVALSNDQIEANTAAITAAVESLKINVKHPPIDQDLLQKYILYAKQYNPRLDQVDKQKIANLYADIRKTSMKYTSIPVTARLLESMVRLSEANAKMHLRQYVNSTDVDVAIKIVLSSFLNCQKYYVKRKLEKQFKSYLKPEKYSILNKILNEMMYDKIRYLQAQDMELENEIELNKKEFESKCGEIGVDDLSGFYAQMADTYRLEESVIVKCI
eukprot:NODE_352_length_10276_cov_0.244178.p1 type:complete len:859 gc:universal NODE_352_length_10276_cov_0.244178:7263-9839(+)